MSDAESGARGAVHHHRLRNAAAAILLASVACPTQAAAAATAAAQSPGEDPNRDIIIMAPLLFPDVRPERDLDREGIESYGVSTVDQLLAEVQGELDPDDDQPLILVNGQRVFNLGDIGTLPVEVLRNVQVLPRGSAVRAGGTSNQRVISLTLVPSARLATLVAAPKFATEGDWHGERGEGILTYVKGQTRANLALRARDESFLFESDRGIIQPAESVPFALGGNVVGFPSAQGEIDPLLSAAAGQIVTVTPIPVGSNPALAAFANGANHATTTDIGEFRTLQPKTHNYDLTGTYATRLTSWLTSTATFRLARDLSELRRGLPSGLFILSETNPASPFSRDVQLALYGADPLRSRSRTTSGDLNLTLNGQIGRWNADFNGSHARSKDTSRIERQSVFGATRLADTINPFATEMSDLIPFTVDRTTSRSRRTDSDLTLTGPAATLPAGDLTATVEGRLVWAQVRSRSDLSVFGDRNFRRNEQSVRTALNIPLTSRAKKVGGAIGDLTATAEYTRVHYSDAGSLNHHALGLIWEPIPMLRLRAGVDVTGRPGAIQLLGSPVIVTPNVRVFDPLTGQTVDVTQITGGNPSLAAEKATVRRVSALVRLIPRIDLQLNAEYTDSDVHNYISSLPSASAAVMLAFPDRYVRNGAGALTSIDLRPVNFESHRDKRLRWGLSMNRRIQGKARAADNAAGSAKRSGPIRRSTYIQLTANHTMVFSDKLLIRPALDDVNLLGGGAIGIGGGRVRHQVDGTASITSGGLGARIGVNWRGPSTLQSRVNGQPDSLHFSPLFLLNLRAFTDVRRIMPSAKWARGMRLSLDVINLTNDRQKVRDSFGHTPLQYQPGYRDALGRTVEIELRKVF